MIQRKTIATGLMAFMFIAGQTSCEKVIFDEEETATERTENVTNETGEKTDKDKGKYNVVLRVSNFNMVPITRDVVDLTTYCTRLIFVVYKDGEKIAGKSQMKEDDENFGEVKMKLDVNTTYKLMVLAHSSKGGNPVVSDPENIQFTNALGYTDTFCYYGDLEVKSGETVQEVTLTRVSSQLCFTITDEIPAEVTHMYFYYTGGSGVLNAVTGFGGNVNSRQEKNVNVVGYSAPLPIHIFTFLRENEGSLNLKAEALDANKNVVHSREFENVPMKRNAVTIFEGAFFSHDQSFTIKGETEWNDTIRLDF